MLIVYRGTLGEVPVVALFRRRGEDVTARLDRDPHPGGRERRIPDHAGHPLELRPGPGEIAGDRDRYRLRSAGPDVEKMNLAGLLVDDRIGPRRRVHDVEVLMPGELLDVGGAGGPGVEVPNEAAVRNEVDGV